jgi:hypothetical protein
MTNFAALSGGFVISRVLSVGVVFLSQTSLSFVELSLLLDGSFFSAVDLLDGFPNLILGDGGGSSFRTLVR